MAMIETIKKLIIRYREAVSYLIVGASTTVVNFAVYLLTRNVFGVVYLGANAIAWVAAVLFAYFANRVWVFRSDNANIIRELLAFALSRVFSLALETGSLYASVTLLNINDIIAKIAIAVIVVACNYITGKWLVFKKSSVR